MTKQSLTTAADIAHDLANDLRKTEAGEDGVRVINVSEALQHVRATIIDREFLITIEEINR